MKRVWLLLLALVLCATAYAQQYEMNVKVKVRSNINDVNCDSWFEFTFQTEDGTGNWTWFEKIEMDKGNWHYFENTFYVDADNLVKSINVYARRETDECELRDKGDLVITIPETFYPYTNAEPFEQMLTGYSESTTEITIKPLSGVYAVESKFDGTLNGKYNRYYNNISLLHKNGTRTDSVCNVDVWSLKEDDPLSWRSLVLTAEKKSAVEYVEFDARYNSDHEEKKLGTVTDPSATGNIEGTINDNLFCMNPGNTFWFFYGYVATPINYTAEGVSADASEKPLPSKNTVTLSIPERDSYNNFIWQYKIGNGLWNNMPSSYGKGNTISFSGESFFTSLSASYTNYYFQTVHFQAIYADVPTRVTETISLVHLPSAPGITSVDPIMETCHGYNDAGVLIKFDRALYTVQDEDELLYISIDGETSDAYPKSLAADNTMTIMANLTPGAHVITLTNSYGDLGFGYASGSEHTKTVTIVAREAITNFSATGQNVHCYLGEDGLIDVNAEGGTEAYTIAFTNQTTAEQTSVDFTEGNPARMADLAMGTYLVKLTDSNGCDPDNNQAGITVSITQPAAAVVLSTEENVEPLGYGLTNGHITVRAEKGTYPFTFSWTDDEDNVLTGETPVTEGTSMLATLNNIGRGTYHVVAYDDQYALASPATEVNTKGCYDALDIEVTEPPLLEVTIEETHFVSCNGYADGEIVAHGTGGRPYQEGHAYEPYQYEWVEITGADSTAFGASDSVQQDRYAAQYRVWITDRNGIQATADFVLVQPDPLLIDFNTAELLCNGDTNGTSVALPQGGTIPYTYTWSTGEKTAGIENLAEGWYSVIVKDIRGCTTYGQTEVTVPNSLETDATVVAPQCEGYSNGTITLLPSGGTLPYRYAWAGGETTAAVQNLTQGTYAVTITDANDCFIERTYDLVDPALFVVDLGSDRVLCRDQNFDVDASIADAAATYAWTKDGITFANTAAVTLSEAGTYHLLVTDSDDCMNSDDITITRDDTEIDASLVVATRVPQGGEVRIANISNPTPEAVTWIVPDGATVVEETDEYIDLIFDNLGEYQIGITGYQGNCFQTSYEPVEVVDPSELTDYETPDEPYIMQFMVTPNPNNGAFTVTVELREAGNFQLVLYNGQGNVITQKDYTREESISEDFDVAAVTGTGIHLLQLVTDEGYAVFKVAINK